MFHKLLHHPFMDQLRKPCNMDLAKLILRLAIGAIFTYHGQLKFKAGMAGIAGFFGHIGIPMSGLSAPFISGLELFGGILLMLGLGTRLIGLLLFADMLVAVGAAFGWKFSKAELESLLGAASLSLFFSDAGAYSLDAWLMKRSAREHAASLPAVKA